MQDQGTIQEIQDRWMSAVHRASAGRLAGPDPTPVARRAITTLALDPSPGGWGVFHRTGQMENEHDLWPFFLAVMDETAVVRLMGQVTDGGHALFAARFPIEGFEHVAMQEQPAPKDSSFIQRQWRFQARWDWLGLTTMVPYPGIEVLGGTVGEERFARTLARACGWNVEDHDAY